jgi:phosphatidylserine/phosphatidylglycerophosphate/cardiolipin synthase-like enzyme
MMVDGEAARAITELARQRWARAAIEELPEVPRGEAPWPDGAEPHFRSVEVAIARTDPPYAAHAVVQEVETLFHDMVAIARRGIYVESQYLTCSRFARALAKAMRRNPELEAVIVTPFRYRGRLERTVMASGRARVARILRKARVADRVLLCAPRISHEGKDADPHVHAKVMIVDDQYLRVDSANLCHRSMGTDTECDLAVAAGDDEAARATMTRLRNQLIAEHTGASPDQVVAALARHGSLLAAIRSLPKREHWLGRWRPLP